MGKPSHFWNKCRTGFRLCRICVWLLILILVCAVLWLNRIGLPDFVKQPLIDALGQHGIVLQFARLRLDFSGGLVADNVRVGGETPDSPTLAVQELKLQINYGALLHRKWQLNGVVLRHGKFVLPVSASNEPPCSLVFDHIQTELRFQTNDVWSLDNFQADFAGAKFTLAGQVAHASAVRNWGIFHGKRGLRGATPAQLKKIGIALSRVYFNNTSQLSLNVQGDAANINSFFVFLTVNAPGVDTPWGSFRHFNLVAHSTASATAAAKSGGVAAQPLEIDWKAQVSQLKTGMADVDSAYCAGSWRATGEIDWQGRLARLKSEKLDADFISCGGIWRAPEVEVTNLFARLGGGRLQAAARLNLITREFSFTNSCCFDLQAVNALLTEKTRERLAQFTLPQPPWLAASGSLILAPWTNAAPDYWRTNVQPTIRLNGELAATNLAFSGLSFDQVRCHFSYSNEIWTVPDGIISQPEGRLQISGDENDATKDYQWHLRGALSPEVIQPFLTPKAARGFHDFTFNQPVFLDAQLRGRLYDYDSISAAGHAVLTNFFIRGEPVDSVETDFRYARRVADFFHPHLQAPGAQTMRADGIRLDWPGDRIYFTNGVGTAYPQEVAVAIGPIPAQVMKPYHFLAPPTANVNGYAPLRDPTNADLDFKINRSAQLECLKLRTHAITGEIHWRGQTLVLTNLSSTSLYGGSGDGNAVFDFQPHTGANFSFAVNVQNADLHLLARDLSSASNHLEHLEGIINGRFVVTSGNSGDWRSCNGYGHVDVSNGLLWDVPVFGVLSPVLNTISPGLGNSRATDASAQFFMTNGVISTDNLQIHTMLMVLKGGGTVDLRGNMHADFTADLLRGVPALGPFFSMITSPVAKAFECKVTGAWQKPKIRPVYLYVPMKFLFYMSYPFHSLGDLFPADKQNAAPKK